MMPTPHAAHAPTPQTHLVYCDGGLCNRLNALIYALVLRNRYGHAWSAAWPVNNWCGAAFGSLFSIDMPVGSRSLQHYAALQADDRNVRGLHIRTTDFGAAVDDARLVDAVAVHQGRFFVCSDDAGVNARFGTLANCCVLEKTHFPQKLLADGDWNASTTDGDGRRFPFNITRPEESVLEALADLLILSATTPLSTSRSTFLGMARTFQAADFFRP